MNMKHLVHFGWCLVVGGLITAGLVYLFPNVFQVRPLY
jgi:hypothetical protein